MPPYSALMQILVGSMLNHCTARKNLYGIALSAVSAALGFVGILLIILASYRWLLDQYYVWQAIALVAGEAIGFALLIGLAAAFLLHKKKNIFLRTEEKAFSGAKDILSLVNQDAEAHVRDNPKMALAIAILAGLLVGRKI